MAKGGSSKGNAGAAIMSCTCEHEFQDRRYGRGMRVKNECNKGWQCSVCGKEGV